MKRSSMNALAAVVMAMGSGVGHAEEFPLPPREWPSPVADQAVYSNVVLDRFEYQSRAGADAQTWDLQGWVGGDYNKFWFKSEGERTSGSGVESADIQGLYARLISPYWYLQVGVRGEPKPSPSRTQGVLAIQGIAPYWFDVAASAFLSTKGKLSARFEAERDFLLTQRLILQPRLETQFSASSEPERQIGSGITNIEVGLRLRYEIRREFAPYIGISWSHKPGQTGQFARAAGEDTRSTSIVLGVRAWY